MNAARLRAVPVERVWGRRDIPAGFPRLADDVPVGEIWFEAPAGAGLLVKYLFTAERLSIQVHPDDAAARGARPAPRQGRGLVRARRRARARRSGSGLTREVSREALRAAALDGSIEALLDWRPVARGDIFYSPAGTIHAIGGGIVADRDPAESRPHLSALRLWPAPGAASRRSGRGGDTRPLVAAVRAGDGRARAADPRRGRRLRARALDRRRRALHGAGGRRAARRGRDDRRRGAGGRRGLAVTRDGRDRRRGRSTCWSPRPPRAGPQRSRARGRRAWRGSTGDRGRRPCRRCRA